MRISRKWAVILPVTVVTPLLGWSYLQWQTLMRVPPLPVVAPRERPPEKQLGSPCAPSDHCGDAVPDLGPLAGAAQSGDLDAVRRLLNGRTDHASLNQALFAAAGSAGLTLSLKLVGPQHSPKYVEIQPDEAHGFHYAQIVRLLLKAGAEIGARDESGGTPLIAAARAGEADVVAVLLENGAEIEDADSDGITGLMWAACNCHIIDPADTHDAMHLLLDKGAQIERSDNLGSTALTTAASWGRTGLARLLLDHGAQIEGRDRTGNTPLHVAAAGGAYGMADTVKLLLGRGADIEAKNNDGATPLILAASRADAEHVKIVKLLLAHGAQVEAKDAQGATALDRARKQRRTAIVGLLKAAAARQP